MANRRKPTKQILHDVQTSAEIYTHTSDVTSGPGNSEYRQMLYLVGFLFIVIINGNLCVFVVMMQMAENLVDSEQSDISQSESSEYEEEESTGEASTNEESQSTASPTPEPNQFDQSEEEKPKKQAGGVALLPQNISEDLKKRMNRVY